MTGMNKQNLIKRTLLQPKSIVIIRHILAENPNLRRSEIANLVCIHFSFFNSRGRLQRSGCLKALRELERVKHFILPKPSRGAPGKTIKRLRNPVDQPENVPAKAGEIRDLSLIIVKTDEHQRIWNELMEGEHPRGSGHFVGAQIRYLITSEHGWLGGLGFSASALKLKDREKWIGWDTSARQNNLHRIIGMSRFLIRPSIHCHNLASRVLGLALRRLADDIEARYHYRPYLVESFNESRLYKGICYQASNWELVGKTQGRGRQGGPKKDPEKVKDIYMYPLIKDFRTRLGVLDKPDVEAINITEGLEGDIWANNEFGDADLGDLRLSKRLIEAARIQAEKPGRAFCGAASGDWPMVKGYYRMIDQPDESAISMEAILAPHHLRTVQRIAGQDTILNIQDGCELNYNNLPQCNGLGFIGANQTKAKTRGLHLHSTLAFTTEGLPLGILASKCSAPRPALKGQSAQNTPIEEKKTFSWIKSLRDTNELAKTLPDTRQICVMDREGDFFELFDEPRHERVEILVRAHHDRNIIGCENRLFLTLQESEVKAELTVCIPRQSERPKRSKQKAKPGQAKRTAKLALYYRQIELRPPGYMKGKAPIKLWAIMVREESPPENVEPLQWVLLTSCRLDSVKQAIECVDWYKLRWRIEDWHRVLKSGCGIMKLQHNTAERLKRAIAIRMVIAWRIMLMTLLGRECPELPAECMFSDIEILVLNAYASKKKVKKKFEIPLLLGDAVRMVAMMGGYLGRKSDPPPGHQIMWQGFACLQQMCIGYELREMQMKAA